MSHQRTTADPARVYAVAAAAPCDHRIARRALLLEAAELAGRWDLVADFSGTRTPSARTPRAPNVTREPYASGLVRLRVGVSPQLEITCVEDDVETLARWASEHLDAGTAFAGEPMPVEEFRRRPWRQNYRWSLAAWGRSETADRRERQGGSSGASTVARDT